MEAAGSIRHPRIGRTSMLWSPMRSIRDSLDASRTGVNGRRSLNWLEAQIRGTACYRLSRHFEWRVRGSDLAIFPARIQLPSA